MVARQHLEERGYGKAQELASDFIDRHPDDPLVAEALLVRADSQLLRGNYYKALLDYESIAKTYPGSEAFSIALERQFYIARIFASGTKRKLWGLRLLSAKDEAEEIFIRIHERLPGSKLAQRAGRTLADYYFDQQEMDLAAIAYRAYIENYPNTEDLPEAIQRLVYTSLATVKGPNHDSSGLYDAREWLNRIRERFPAEAQQMGADALQTRIDESDATQMLVSARWYLERDDPPSARFLLKRILRRYPQTVSGRRAYALLVDNGWADPRPVETSVGSLDEALPSGVMETDDNNSGSVVPDGVDGESNTQRAGEDKPSG